MPNTTKGYRVALFLKSANFGVSDFGKWPHHTKSSSGYILRLGTKNSKYFIHPSNRSDFLTVETDDTKTQASAIRELGSYAKGMGKTLDPATLDKPKALDFIRSLEQDGLFKEGKLHVYYGDTVTWVKGRLRTKIVFNNRNTAEAKGLSDQQVWGIRGIGVTLVRAGKKHYGLVFFDDAPTARVTKIAAPMNDDLHEELADRLVSRF